MITHFHIENFKSLVNFHLPPRGQELAGFTCLIGMNGAGKTTLLQAFDFTAQLMAGRVGEWLEKREWTVDALLTRLGGVKSRRINIAVSMKLEKEGHGMWEASFDVDQLRCVTERITINHINPPVLEVFEGGRMDVQTCMAELESFSMVPFEYQGSVLSTLRLDPYDQILKKVREILLSLHSLELLSPQLIRRSSRESEDIGQGGERLAGFISQLSEPQREELLHRLRKIYPKIEGFKVEHKVYGWKGLQITEHGTGGNMVTEAHVNDGFLRILAMLSQAYAKHKILLLDEIENGINPAVADQLMNFLVSLCHEGRQVIVTTHSPVVLNYLDDDVARVGVILLYKTENGSTRCLRYFDIPENDRKLCALGPGEVFLDTSIEALTQRLAAEETQILP